MNVPNSTPLKRFKYTPIESKQLLPMLGANHQKAVIDLISITPPPENKNTRNLSYYL